MVNKINKDIASNGVLQSGLVPTTIIVKIKIKSKIINLSDLSNLALKT